MFPYTWKPQGRCRCSCSGCILLQDIFCHLQTAHYFMVRFDYLFSTVNGWSSPHTVGLVSVIIGNFGWSAAHKHICQTHLLPFTSHLLPCLSVWHLETEHWQPSSPPSCHTCRVHEKLFFGACFMWGQASSGFLPLWTVTCWHQIAFQMFPEECILSAVVSAVGRHVFRSIPKLALILAAFKSSCHWLAKISYLWVVWLLAC